MTVTLWDTDGTEVLRALAAERRTSGAVASGVAVTLVVLVDEPQVRAAEEAATVAAAAHPCRLVFVVRRGLDAESRLDAEVSVGGRFGPTEAVALRMWGRLTLHPESVVLPLLAADTPVITWWHGPPPDEIATDPLGVLADRRITDCAQAADPLAALHRRAVDYAPGDTDLAWTRTTPWRSLLAASFDALPATAVAATVTASPGNPTAALLGGWLGGRLGVPVHLGEADVPGVGAVSVEVTGPDGSSASVGVERPQGRLATLSLPGRPDRLVPVGRRPLGELLAEEMRRLDPDETYADALSAATAVGGLQDRDARRRFVWRDPADTGR